MGFTGSMDMLFAFLLLLPILPDKHNGCIEVKLKLGLPYTFRSRTVRLQHVDHVFKDFFVVL